MIELEDYEEKKTYLHDKGEFLKSLSQEELNNGCVLFDLPSRYDIKLKKGKRVTSNESIWGWVNAEDKKKYHDDGFYGEITAILLNDPLTDLEHLLYKGIEVKLQCRGPVRPILSSYWLNKYIYRLREEYN